MALVNRDSFIKFFCGVSLGTGCCSFLGFIIGTIVMLSLAEDQTSPCDAAANLGCWLDTCSTPMPDGGTFDRKYDCPKLPDMPTCNAEECATALHNHLFPGNYDSSLMGAGAKYGAIAWLSFLLGALTIRSAFKIFTSLYTASERETNSETPLIRSQSSSARAFGVVVAYPQPKAPSYSSH